MKKFARAGAVLTAIGLVLCWMESAAAQESQATDPAHFEHRHHHPVLPVENEPLPAAAEAKNKQKNRNVKPNEKEQSSMPGMAHDIGSASDPHAGHKMHPSASQTGTAADSYSAINAVTHGPHDAASMQGATAPDDLRDPHAYSGGFSSGPFPPPIMADEEYFSGLIVDRLESVTSSQNAFMTYDFQAWYGKTYNRALVRAEGNINDGSFEHARSELLWAHAADAYWDMHLGFRYDQGFGPDRGWLAFGFQGMAPYWIYVEATAYVNEQGRTAFRIETEYDILLTQKLILQPRIEANFYGMRDPARRLGNGLSDLAAGLRLHYEIKRELAPYIGIEWAGTFGDTADFIRMSGNDPEEWRAIAGVQFWF